MAAGKAEDAPLAAETTVCNVVGLFCGGAAAALKGNEPGSHRHMQLHVPSESCTPAPDATAPGLPTARAGTIRGQSIIRIQANNWELA